MVWTRPGPIFRKMTAGQPPLAHEGTPAPSRIQTWPIVEPSPARFSGPQWPSPAFARFGLKHQLSIDGDLNIVSDDDTGALAREFPAKAKVLPID